MLGKTIILLLSINYINAGNLYARGGHGGFGGYSVGVPSFGYGGGRSYEVVSAAPAGGWSAGGGDEGWVEGPPHGYHGGHGGHGGGLLRVGSEVISNIVRIPSRILGLVRNTLSGLRGSRGWGAPAVFEASNGWDEAPQRVVAFRHAPTAHVHSAQPIVYQNSWEGYGQGGASSSGSGWDGAADSGATIVGDGGNVWDNNQVIENGDEMATWSGYGNGGGVVAVGDSDSGAIPSGGYGAPAVVSSGSVVANSGSAIVVEAGGPSSSVVAAPVEIPTRVIDTHRQVYRVHNTDSHEHKVHEHNHQTQKVRETHEHQRVIHRNNLHRHNLRNINVHQKNTHQHIVHEHNLQRHNVHLTKVVQPVIHNYEQQRTRVLQNNQHQTRVIPNFQRVVQTHQAQDVEAAPVVYNHPAVRLADEPVAHNVQVQGAFPVAVSHNIETLSSGHSGHSGAGHFTSSHAMVSSGHVEGGDSSGGYSNQVDKVVAKN